MRLEEEKHRIFFLKKRQKNSIQVIDKMKLEYEIS